MKNRKLTPEQEASRDARREKFRALVKHVAEMTDEQKAHLTAKLGAVLTCDGHALSLHNTLMLLTQCPNVSVVGGFRQWIKAGRVVRKGEHGHMIWLPRVKGGGTEATATPAPAEADAKPEMRFLMGTVFDVSQTDELEAGTAAPVATESEVAA